MALVTNPCLCRIFYRSLSMLKSYLHIQKYGQSTGCKYNSTEDTFAVDSMDEFTSQLMQKKINKWSIKTVPKLTQETIIGSVSCGRTKDLDTDAINARFQEAIDIEDNCLALKLMKECVEHRKCPSLSNINYVLAMCAQNGDKDIIYAVKKLCEELHQDILIANSNFKHYLAEAMWVKGNIGEALKLFQEVYEENPFLRRRIRLVLKYLIIESFSSTGEAVLVNIVRFAENLAKSHNDYFPLQCIWQTCFLSEWYADQELSLELLCRNDNLCKAVLSRIPYVVSLSLHNHRTEVVYRLLEILLQYKLKTQYAGVLLSLFDYQIRKGDIRSCSEIIQWSLIHGIKLLPVHNERFIKLLIIGKLHDSEIKEKLNTTEKSKTLPNYIF